MNEAQQAWRLWHLLQEFSDALWTRYESEFLDYCSEERENKAVRSSIPTETDLPF